MAKGSKYSLLFPRARTDATGDAGCFWIDFWRKLQTFNGSFTSSVGRHVYVDVTFQEEIYTQGPPP